MKERPILFSAPMVRAILAGTKTQTRRVVKFNIAGNAALGRKSWHIDDPNAVLACPYGQPGDQLWVRETFAEWIDRELFTGRPLSVIAYRAGRQWRRRPEGTPPSLPIDQWELFWDDDYKPQNLPWRPSIFMPRARSRITLEVTEVRVQRLQDITAKDAWAEGIAHSPDVNPVHEFQDLWGSINGASSWDANPWVWVVSFQQVQP